MPSPATSSPAVPSSSIGTVTYTREGSTRNFSASVIGPSGSEAIAVTRTGSASAGSGGSCDTSVIAGPALSTVRLLRKPGVPFGWTCMRPLTSTPPPRSRSAISGDPRTHFTRARNDIMSEEKEEVPSSSDERIRPGPLSPRIAARRRRLFVPEKLCVETTE